MTASRPPDDTPTRLQRITALVDERYSYPAWLSSIAADDIKFLLADVSRLQQENAYAMQHARASQAETATLREENALLRRSLEMLTKQLDEKDEEITDLRFTIIRHNSPA